MPPTSANGSPWATLIPIAIAMAVVILRNSRARRLRIEAMWIAPVIIVAMIGVALWAESRASVARGGAGFALTPLNIGLDIAGVIAGALLGWWRARFTSITIDPATHELTSRASPLGMVVILGILVIRTAVRTYATGGALGEWAAPVADALLVMSVGLVCAQRLEIYIRANRLLNEAGAGGSPS
ncbi:hypothetical protein [Phenylobacterium sp.]|uniref:hypothetical protein n=1 Tax=Phenylobacterium sp. TaxID=1871053 RepID=UPI002C95D36C|nr:hypothetical protein [Phenylobacterium sp.]HLZ75938.1 hypothetical protein [Phenylobacterium sp.]